MKDTCLLFVGNLVLSLLMLGCAPTERADTRAGGEPSEILVGEYGSMSGPEATFGQGTHNGIMLALDEINSAGGVNGRKIKVITEDDQSKQEEAANAVTKLISRDHVVAILGAAASSNSLAGAPICQSNKVPMITPGSTNPEVTKKGDYIFRTCFIDPYQGEALANYIAKERKVKRVAILRDVKSDYSMGLADVFTKTFVSLGGQVVEDQSYSKGDSDFRPQLTAMKSAAPEVLFVPGYYTEIGQVAIQARDLGMNQPLMGGDGWDSPKLVEIGGEALEGSFYTNHHHPDDPSPAVRKFVDSYKMRYGVRPDGGAALGYDSMRMLAAAMRRASSLDGPSLRDEIARTKEFAGVTGSITIGPERNPLNKKFVVLEVRGGRVNLLTAIEPKE